MNTNIAIDAITVDPHTARRVALPPAADAGLRASMTELGMLQPVVVVRSAGANGYILVAGRRRLEAARELGWSEVPAVELSSPVDKDVSITAVSAAENMVRRALDPIDQWRALTVLTEQGYPISRAAASLGIEDRLARRLALLGSMAPEVIAAIEACAELPQANYLRLIAAAPLETQQAAMRAALGKREASDVSWWDVASACQVKRISRSRAVFDVDSTDVVFEEDLFAEPGSDDQFTTTDVKGFLAAQRAAIEARAAASKGRIVVGVMNERYEIVPPDGYVTTYDQPQKRWKKDDQRKHVMAITPSGYRAGEVVERVAELRQSRASASQTNGASHAAAEPERKREPVSKAAVGLMAAAKGEAVRAALPDFAATRPATDLLRAVLLLFAAKNVSVQTASQLYGCGSIEHHVSRLRLSDESASPLDIAAIAAEVIGQVVRFDHPNGQATSGAVAETIALLVGAKPPRCDTEEILQGIAGAKLREIAKAHGIETDGTVSALRKRMVGNLPDWQGATFDAGPPVREPDDEDEDEDEDAEPEDNDDDPPLPPAAKRRRGAEAAA